MSEWPAEPVSAADARAVRLVDVRRSLRTAQSTQSANHPDLPLGPACPFTIVVDTREQNYYTFENIRPKSSPNSPAPKIQTVRLCLSIGDYSLFGFPGIAIERKSKEDLYGSVARRKNFIHRLERMNELTYAAVVVEAEFFDCIAMPPPHSKLHPRSLSGTLIAWRQRYRNVDWYFMPGREAAERATFRILERFYIDHRNDHRNDHRDEATAL